jgi:hypothetical protein
MGVLKMSSDSKKWFVVENSGVADVESFTLLGISSARGDDESIGQFGSGAKHAILVLLRAGLQLVICCGGVRIVPFLEEIVVNGVESFRLCFKIGTKTERTSMTLGFGELDWSDDVRMAMREIVSNALDQSDQDWRQISTDVVDNVRCKKGTTRVFVEFDARVRDYYARIGEYFLHWSGEQNKRVLAKVEPSPVRFHRLGVFVREQTRDVSLWNYNADSTLPIDESRNMDSYKTRSQCAKILTDGEHQDELRKTLRILAKDSHFYEGEFSSWYLNQINVRTAFVEEFGESTYVTQNDIVAAKIREKGYSVVVLPSGYVDAINGATGESNLSAESMLGAMDKREEFTETEPTMDCLDMVQHVWDQLDSASMTCGREMPDVKTFVSHMNEGSQTYGFWDACEPSIIHLHDDHATNPKTILEELTHYITHAADETRDFQDFVLRFATRIMPEFKSDDEMRRESFNRETME